MSLPLLEWPAASAMYAGIWHFLAVPRGSLARRGVTFTAPRRGFLGET